MSEAKEKLQRDLSIMEEMAAEMDEYLKSETLFWPLIKGGDLPRLTLGGYLMRQSRLKLLRDLLEPNGLERLDAAIEKFNHALVEKIVRFETKAHEELQARLRQWGEYLKDLSRESGSYGDYYVAAVEARVMIAVLLDKLAMPPYQLDGRVLDQLSAYDRVLRNYWQPGEFVWQDGWQQAYPKNKYWWLYGSPRSHKDS